MKVKVVEERRRRIEGPLTLIRYVLNPEGKIVIVGVTPRAREGAIEMVKNGIPHFQTGKRIFIDDEGIGFELLQSLSLMAANGTYQYTTKILEMDYEESLVISTDEHDLKG